MIHRGTKDLKSERLKLRKFSVLDAHSMYNNWASDDEVTKFLTWRTHQNINETKEILKEWESNYEDNTYNWAIEFKPDNTLIGGISVVRIDTDKKAFEIGYCMSKKYWGKGIMTESLNLVIDYLFGEVSAQSIYARFNTNNLASGKVMEKCHMTYKETNYNVSIENKNTYCDVYVYEITKETMRI